MRTARALIIRPLLITVCLAASLALGAGGVLVAFMQASSVERVYTVAEAKSLLARHTASWEGQTIQVRGMVAGCPLVLPGPCASWEPRLRTNTARPTDPGLLLVPVQEKVDALTAFLRRMPWTRGLASHPQLIQWGSVATYRVRIGAAGCRCSHGLRCSTALLLNAAPVA